MQEKSAKTHLPLPQMKRLRTGGTAIPPQKIQSSVRNRKGVVGSNSFLRYRDVGRTAITLNSKIIFFAAGSQVEDPIFRVSTIVKPLHLAIYPLYIIDQVRYFVNKVDG